MKKYILLLTLLTSAAFSSTTYAAGCSSWGTVNYMYKSSTGVLAIIGGQACFVSSGDLNAVASVLAVAKANGVQGYVTSSGEVAIQYN